MNSTRGHLRQLLIAAGTILAIATGTAAPPADDNAIRQLMSTTWDTPDARVEAGPLVIEGRHAIAGWTQGPRGGRALLRRDEQGHWSVAACGGDGLKAPKALQSFGLSPAEAQRLGAALARAERDVPAARLAQFSTFDGIMKIGAGDAHGAHGASGGPRH